MYLHIYFSSKFYILFCITSVSIFLFQYKFYSLLVGGSSVNKDRLLYREPATKKEKNKKRKKKDFLVFTLTRSARPFSVAKFPRKGEAEKWWRWLFL